MALSPPKKFEVLIDKKENPRKCTIQCLGRREDFLVRFFGSKNAIPPFSADCLLHVEGEDLSEIKKGSFHSLALLDCTWKKVQPTLNRIESPLPKLVRIPDGFSTAYPRKNKKGEDPSAGLATVEALFIAAAFLGIWDKTLLENYHFAQKFLNDNAALWEKFGLGSLQT